MKVKLNVKRSNSDGGDAGYSKYQIDAPDNTTLLDALIQVREYEDKDGNARTSVEVVASKVRFLGRGNTHGEEKRPVPGQPKAKAGQPSTPADDFNQSGDDVPF